MTENTTDVLLWACDTVKGRKCGYFEAYEYDAVSPSRPHAQFCSVFGSVCSALMASGTTSGVCVRKNGRLTVRYLTERESFRLMGQKDDDIDNVLSLGLSRNTLYRLAGNSIVVDVAQAILRGIYLDRTFTESRGKQTSLDGLL